MSGARSESRPASRVRGASVVLWALQVVLALLFAMVGLSELFGDPAMVGMFADIGIGQWFRCVVGALEVAGAAGVLIPRLSGLAALGLACVMLGAVFTNLFVLGASPLLPLIYLALAALVVWGRWPRTRALLGGSGR